MLTTKLGIATKNEFEEDFLNTFGETMRNIRYHKEMKLSQAKRNIPSIWWNQNLKIGIHFSKIYLL